MRLEHLLLTTDLSPEALRPFADVLELARKVGAKVTILHVLQDPLPSTYGSPFGPAIAVPDLEKLRASAAVALAEQCAALPLAAKAEKVVVEDPSPVRAIVDYARAHDVDLIAISTHGRSGLRHMALGSVAEAVLRQAPCPVLVVRSKA